MNRKALLWTGILISFGFFISALSWAGQVVTNQEKEWAKKVIKEEGALKAPPSRNTLAVLNFKNQTGQSELDPLQKGVALMLITDLSQLKEVQVLERVQMQALVEELGLGASGLVAPDSAPRVGKLLGAHWLVGGEILTARGEVKRLRVDSNLLDVPLEKTVGNPSAEGEWAELFRLEKDLLFELIKQLRIAVTPQEEARLRIPCSTNTRALIALFKGIDASDRGNYALAAEQYEAAVKEDGRICIGTQALEELRILRLIPAKKSVDLLRSLRDQTSLTNQLTTKETEKRVPPATSVPTPIRIGITFP